MKATTDDPPGLTCTCGAGDFDHSPLCARLLFAEVQSLRSYLDDIAASVAGRSPEDTGWTYDPGTLAQEIQRIIDSRAKLAASLSTLIDSLAEDLDYLTKTLNT
jgi:hypothetical protein